MNIPEVYLRKIAQKVLHRMLADGVIPSAEALLTLSRKETLGRNLNSPAIAQPKPTVEFKEAASASKFNGIIGRIVDDLDVLYDTSLESEKTIALSSTRALIELSRIEKEVSQLINRANALLLRTDQTEGLLDVLGDSFEDTSKIDLVQTTSFYDATAQSIHGGFVNSERVIVASELSLNRLQVEDVRVTPLDPALQRNPGTHDSTVLDMFGSGDNPWLYTVRADRPMESAAIEVRIDLRRAINSGLGISKVVLDPFVTNNSILVLIQYSTDGETWYDLPVVSPTRRIAGPTAYFLDKVAFTHLRIVLSKDIHDRLSDGYVYDFGIRHLGISTFQNPYSEESELVSLPLMAPDNKRFTQVSLSKACEYIPQDTSIDYSIAFLIPDGDGYETTDFYRIIPLNREDITGPLVLEVEGAASTLIPGEIAASDIDYPYADNRANRLLDLDSESSEPAVEVWRNIGYKDKWITVMQPDGKVVDAGWYNEGPYYYTYGLVSDPGGVDIDFGPSPIEIDGIEVSGHTRLSAGVHKFRVHERNWFSLKGIHQVTLVDSTTKKIGGKRTTYGPDGYQILVGDVPDTENFYQVIDPLYPFNHKLLIEGLSYSGSFNGERVYRGLARFSAYFPKLIPESEFGLNTPDTDYNKFCLTRRADSSTPRVMVKWIQRQGDLPRERYLVVKKVGTEAEGLIFKATFKTANPQLTPSLDGYELKIV